MNFILYARKSTRQEERQPMSIPAQIRELNQMVEGLGFKIEKTFTEEFSAKKRGRPEFGKMLKYLAKQKDCCLIAWKCDRIARNNFDGAEIVDLLQEGNIKEIRTIDRVYTSNASDLYNLMQEFGMGKKFCDELSVNVKRGNREKLLAGGWPHMAPYGYLNDKAEKTIFVDKSNAKYIVRLFSLYSKGNKSFKEMANILYDEGMRSKAGNKIPHSTLHRLINNTFYYGLMLDNGNYYQGKHKPIISKQVFDRAQEVLHGKKDSRKTERFYPYRGFMTCAVCGCVLTGDIKKEKYIYYFCTNGKGHCKQHEKYMASKKAGELMANCFDLIRFDEKMIEMAYQAAKRMSADNKDSQQELSKSIDSKLKTVQERHSRLLDTYIDNGLPKADYDAKSNELKAQIIDLENQQKNISKIIGNQDSTFELTKEIFLTANKAKKEFQEAKDDKRVIVLENLLSNLVVKDKEMASVSFKMPYEILKNHPKNGDFSQMLGKQYIFTNLFNTSSKGILEKWEVVQGKLYAVNELLEKQSVN